jgi:hypothetical protein
MSIENELVTLVLERIVDILRSNLPAQSAREHAHFFVDTVMDYADGRIVLGRGFRDTKIATVLNGGVFDVGESILVIKTADGALWGYAPYGVGPIIRERLFSLRNVYILTFIDASGSMNWDIPAIAFMLEEMRADIQVGIYGGDEEQIARYFPPPVYVADEQFVRWMATIPPEELEGEQLYNIITMSFIDESSPSYGPTEVWVRGGDMTPTFMADVARLAEVSQRRRIQKHLVFNVNRYNWKYGDFLLDAAQHLVDFGFAHQDVPPDQPAEFYAELIQTIIRGWGR